jgi:hypothetical protein
VVLAIGSREHIDENCRGGASVEEDTTDVSESYARFGPTGPARYQQG